jgi:uncharacterized protein (DUF2336 family)
MFEPAVQSPGETITSAQIGAAARGTSRQSGDQAHLGQIESGRRFTAEDFRALIARLSKGAAERPKRLRSAAVAIVVPEFVAWHLPSAPQAETDRDAEADDPLATEPSAVAEAPDTRGGEQELGADATDHDAGDDSQPAEAASGPPPQNDTPTEADEPAGVAEMAEVTAHDAAASDSADDEPQEQAADTCEPADPEPAEAAAGPVAAEAAMQPTEPADTIVDPELQSAETARTLLDIMAMPSGVQPQERALAGDTLLRLVSRMPVASLIALCDRLCIMEAPPPLLVRRLIQHDNIEVSGPLLERCPGISDQDLMTMINMGDAAILRLIARRRHLSPALTDALIRHGDAAVTIAVVRNPGAALSHEAFSVLAEAAKSRTSLQAPLATRPDTPAPIAFELFWTLPPQLRRYVLSRFLTESANLDRILKIAHTLDESTADGNGSPRIVDKAECDELIGLIAQGKTAEAAQKLAGLAGISTANAQRIIADSEGEPLTVAMKAIGMSRTQSAAAAETLRDAPEAPLRSNRRIAELQNLFDSLSFTKARVLLTYWDWAVEQSGPYSGKAV